MSQSQTCLIIMDPLYEALGEVLLSDGMYQSMSLNQRGDEVLGPHVEQWQVYGLDHLVMDDVVTSEGPAQVLSTKKITMKSDDFLQALQHWLDDHGFLYFCLPLGAMPVWGELQKKEDMDQKQKLEMVLMLANLPVSKLGI